MFDLSKALNQVDREKKKAEKAQEQLKHDQKKRAYKWYREEIATLEDLLRQSDEKRKKAEAPDNLKALESGNLHESLSFQGKTELQLILDYNSLKREFKEKVANEVDMQTTKMKKKLEEKDTEIIQLKEGLGTVKEVFKTIVRLQKENEEYLRLLNVCI